MSSSEITKETEGSPVETTSTTPVAAEDKLPVKTKEVQEKEKTKDKKKKGIRTSQWVAPIALLLLAGPFLVMAF